MVRPKRTARFLGRPLSAAGQRPGEVHFLVARRGPGTAELTDMQAGEEVELLGPLGNAWEDFLPAEGKIALAGGGIGIAPLLAFAAELKERGSPAFDLYAGFKTGFCSDEESKTFFGPQGSRQEKYGADRLIIAAEDGRGGLKGRITDFLSAEEYTAVFACGPEAMLRAAAQQCGPVPCYVSTERRMACGVGACLGCTLATANGNRRCCADGPIFNAHSLYGAATA